MGCQAAPRLWFGAEVLISGRLLAVRPILPPVLPYKAAMAPPGLKQALLFCSICITIRAFPVVFVMLFFSYMHVLGKAGWCGGKHPRISSSPLFTEYSASNNYCITLG